MNTTDYISSGIIERHFLGFSTLEEEEDLNRALLLFPELAEEMEEVERRIEKAAINSAVPPPEELRRKFLEIVQEGEAIYGKEQRKIYVNILPSEDTITVHIGWKIFLIFLLVISALALLAVSLYYRALIH
ncbi:hypothetical protein [Chitinophaga sp. LS1]|uniref:hypothetical protein n=1 Tax=Chitinophaga sp. LS1 TaxID=3051176 RepID=UPI002AABC4AD|nr:hypothetical protein [Chitinophaga sp. LS1]WPV65353.1 hypothetical protein QQL36_26485 [Chitinophaga sp. LS1]